MPNIYARFNAEMLQSNYNPFNSYYTDYLPVYGFFNPFIFLVSFFVKTYFNYTALQEAIVINMVTSAIQLFALSLSIFFFLRKLQMDALPALTGSLVFCLLGFPLVAIIAFDHFYQISLMVMPWVFYLSVKVCCSRKKFYYSLINGMLIGFSILGGSNSPLFYFVPILFALPILSLLVENHRPKSVALATNYFYISASFLLGAIFALPILFPSLSNLSEINRSSIDFFSSFPAISLEEKVKSLLFRNWFSNGDGIHYVEKDYYIGALTFILAILGLQKLKKDLVNEGSTGATIKETKILKLTISLTLVYGLIVVNHQILPSFIENLLNEFFGLISIRYPNRFTIVCLFPLSYLCALGFSKLSCEESKITTAKNFSIALIIFLVCVLLTLFKFPDIFTNQVILDKKLAFTYCSICSVIGLVLLYFLTQPLKSSRFLSLIVKVSFSIVFYFSLFFAPLQIQNISNNDYFSYPKIEDLLPTDRASILFRLGFKTNYNETFQRAKYWFIENPIELTKIDPKKGRIFDENMRMHSNLYAPILAYQFAFPNIYDTSAPLRLTKLFKNKTEAIFDHYNVCYLIKSDKKQSVSGFVRSNFPESQIPMDLESRETCLPKYRLVRKPLIFFDEDNIFNWVTGASRNEFLNSIPILCNEENCDLYLFSNDKQTAGQFSDKNKVLEYKTELSQIKIKLSTSTQSFLSLSIPYHKDWKAFSNGKPIPIYRAYFAFMGIPIDPNYKEITLIMDRDNQYIVNSITSIFWLLAFGFILSQVFSVRKYWPSRDKK